MNGWMLALVSGGAQLVTRTFTSSQSVTIPFGVSNLETVSGKGADGAAGYTSTRTAYAQGNTVTGHYDGTGASSGAYSWSDFQDMSSQLAQVNAGGGGNYYYSVYDGYLNTGTYTLISAQTTFSGAVYGTASIVRSADWHTSGAVLGYDYGFTQIQYTQEYTVPPTTGAAATGFGKTFPGGFGGPATTTNFTNVAVTGGSSYSLTVPAGGSITITYYQ